MNIFFGKALAILYGWLPGIKWYLFVQLALLILAFSAITFVFCEKHGKRIGTLLSLGILCFIGYDTYVIFQFTKVAGITAIAGGILVFYSIDTWKMKKIIWELL